MSLTFVLYVVAFYLLWCVLEAVYNSIVTRNFKRFHIYLWESLRSVNPTWKKRGK